MKFLVMYFSLPPFATSPLRQNILRTTLTSNSLNLGSFHRVRGQVSHPHRTRGKTVILCILTITFLLRAPLLVFTIQSQHPVPPKKNSIFKKRFYIRTFFLTMMAANDREATYSWRIHLSVDVVVPATSTCKVLSAHCVTISARSFVMILLDTDKY
jgi:hypothetical protein